uniref:Pituitary tumor-transforming gene 1 protein-interacting protein n=1 Tax=Osmerus mordax TaxID=8014 RepID=C1BJJ8_OSMMO|nr:Pituitary tumor-transforming gene 1 protein-interacting protein precursor [Osmerus mordax]
MNSIERRRVAFPVFSVVLVICFLLSPVECKTTSSTSPCKTKTDCDSCVRNAKCLWCQTNITCTDYPVSYILPPSSLCQLSQARWGVCWVNFEALIIAMAVVGGTLLVSITVCCCCCCCCRRRSQAGPDRDEERFARRREEVRQRTDERKAERKTKHDEIRKKYGLIPDTDHPYSKFENE